jgi:hypothetical protein
MGVEELIFHFEDNVTESALLAQLAYVLEDGAESLSVERPVLLMHCVHLMIKKTLARTEVITKT